MGNILLWLSVGSERYWGSSRAEMFNADRKVDIATHYLEGKVENWWEETLPTFRDGNSTVSWKDFTEAFYDQFFDSLFKQK